MESLAIYDIMINDEGEVLIALDTRPSEPVLPAILVQGKRLFLVRNPEDRVELPEVSQEVIDAISARPDILVAETGESAIDREYIAEVQVEEAA